MNPFQSFEISVKGDLTGNPFDGKFVYKHPNLDEKLKIRALESKMTAKYEQYHPEIAMYNYTLAYLEITLKECPQWFKDCKYGLLLEDENVLEEVSAKIKEFEQNRYKNVVAAMKQELPKKDEKSAS